MKERFVDKRFRAATLAMIETANQICADYRRQGFNLTLRQVYYQFVSRDQLPNNDKSYKLLGNAINDARLAGLMDWDNIQDRTRSVVGSYWGWRDPGYYMDHSASGYYEALWEGQQYRPEIWVEKDALKDVIARAAQPWRIPYFSCRGYASQTAMYDAAKRFQKYTENGLEPVVIHLGDHDPSGIDMTRDIRERLSLMSWGDVDVQRIALNMDQIDEYQPPPNPAKIADSRAADYIDRFGRESWELDALEPRILVDLITQKVEEYVDQALFDEALAHEQEQEDAIRQVAGRFTELWDNWSEVEALLDA
jgi:hypothetical protein